MDNMDEEWGLTIRDKLFFGYTTEAKEKSTSEAEAGALDMESNGAPRVNLLVDIPEDTRQTKKRKVQ